MRKVLWLVGGACLALALAVANEPVRPLHLAVSGLTLDYLEACGCGGRTAGGLARRARLVADARRRWPDLVVVDAGDLGSDLVRLPVVARALSALGTDAVGLGNLDLERWPELRSVLATHGLAATSATPPLGVGPAPTTSLLLGPPGGPRLGLVSVAWGNSTFAELAASVSSALAAVRAQADYVALLAHLPEADARRLVESLPAAQRPPVVLLATDADLPEPSVRREDTVWVPIAHKGRSLSLVTLAPGAPAAVDQVLVDEGPRDERVQEWVDACLLAVLKGESEPRATPPPSFPRATACVPCHAAAVTAWRATAHAGAVETLVRRQRDLAACLRCHDERLRRDGVRAEPGDRGVECAACHDQLDQHLARHAHATLPDTDRCTACHSTEHSPKFNVATYRPAIAAACQAGRRR